MRRATVAALLLLLVASVSHVRAASYGWTVSASDTHPDANTGVPTFAVSNVFLWLQCSEGDGMSAAEFGVEVIGINPLAFTPTNGVLNAGTLDQLLLAVGGCPDGPMLAGSFLIIDLPGSICLVPSAANGILGTVDCTTPVPSLWTAEARGYDSTGADPCETRPEPYLCDSVVSVDDVSWGSIKSLYR